MIGVDTNILLRAVMEDDAVHTPIAQRFLAQRNAASPAFVNTVVLAEFVWSLRVAFDLPREQILPVLRRMIESEAYAFEAREAVLQAYQDYESGIGAFTDRLIGELNELRGCDRTVTFDKGAAARPPFAACI